VPSPPSVLPQPSKKSRKTSSSRHMLSTPIGTHPLSALVSCSYTLSHADVINNNGFLTMCDECHMHVPERHMLRACDGCYPSNIGCSWPEGGLARQFRCRRGALCNTCAEELVYTYWNCSSCLNPSPSHEDVWGFDVDEPSILRHTEGAIWMSSTPKGITSEISPAHAHTLEIEDRKRRHENAIGRFVRFGGMQAVESAAHLVSMYRTNCISLGVQQQMLTSMHDLNDLSLLVEDKGSPVTLMLPRTLTALYERASARRYLDEDIQITKTFLCMAFLSQTAMTVPIVRSNAASIIQSILLDEAYPPGSFHLSYSGEPQVHYCDQFGTEIHGHEPWHGTRWRHLLMTVPVGGYILCISVHSDGVASGAQEKYPFSLTVENFSTLSRPGDRTQRVFGMGSHADIRKARGSSIPENLNLQQKVIKHTLQSRVAAEERVPRP
jgi:hypothetical protein